MILNRKKHSKLFSKIGIGIISSCMFLGLTEYKTTHAVVRRGNVSNLIGIFNNLSKQNLNPVGGVKTPQMAKPKLNPETRPIGTTIASPIKSYTPKFPERNKTTLNAFVSDYRNSSTTTSSNVVKYSSIFDVQLDKNGNPIYNKYNNVKSSDKHLTPQNDTYYAKKVIVNNNGDIVDPKYPIQSVKDVLGKESTVLPRYLIKIGAITHEDRRDINNLTSIK